MKSKQSKDNSTPVEPLEQERATAFAAFQDALLTTGESIETTEEKGEQLDVAFENAMLSLDIRREKQRVRRQWNRVLVTLVVVGFFLSYFMIALIGFGVMHFDNNVFAVPSVVAAGVIETYGLAKLAIQYFFSEDGGDTNIQKQ